ncbi:MAG: hypothetical protein J6B48_07785, partial [Clostridia bacterium]|nr:hypothetical protein [Clostridia bacterium]
LLDTTVENNLYIVDNGDGTKTSYPTFATLGFAPQNFTDVVFAVAYKGDTIPADAQYKEYSVAEYLYSRLYKDDFINKTESDGKDYKRKVHYENMMAYGAGAQDLLNEGEALITEYTYVYFPNNDGTVNGNASGLFLSGESVTVNYTGQRSEINGWYSAGSTGREALTLGENNTLTVTKTTVMSLTPWIYDFVDLTTIYSYATDSSDNSISVDTAAANPTNSSDTAMKVVCANHQSNAALRNEIEPVAINSTANRYVFETDIYLSSDDFSASAQLFGVDLMAVDKTQPVTGVFLGYSNGKMLLRAEKSNISGATASVTLVEDFAALDTWFNLKVCYTFNEDAVYCELYIDGELLYEGNICNPNYYEYGDVVDYLRIRHYKGKTYTVYFDNIYLVQDAE